MWIQDQEVIIKPFFKCKKVSLKIVYSLIKCFFARKLAIVVSIISIEFIINWNISFTKTLKRKVSSKKPCRMPDVIVLHILKQSPTSRLCFIDSKDKLSIPYPSSFAIHRKWSEVLNALDKSINIAPILFTLFGLFFQFSIILRNACYIWRFLQNPVRYLENLSRTYVLIWE